MFLFKSDKTLLAMATYSSHRPKMGNILRHDKCYKEFQNVSCFLSHLVYEPRCEKTGPRGFRPGPTQTGLCNH